MKNKNLKTISLVVLVSAVTAIACLFIFKKYLVPDNQTYISEDPFQVHYASYDKQLAAGPSSFTKAANEVIPFTVHINTKVPPEEVSTGRSANPFGGFWGGSPYGRQYSPGKLASGSGVIISKDGYIVTNNHVIDGASDIVVTLNDQNTYKAKLVGKDPNTDLAVLKIDTENLPYATFGNSDAVQIGQWVLACGFPLNLQSTVTAGIISAKSRDIGVNTGSLNPIETYLQTDAAVNPGNSGGPLVNTDGKLVGINSAIATQTGSFAGYAYAVPSNLVRKVVDDIIKYGKVQRAFLGVYLQKENKMRKLAATFKNTGKSIEPGVELSGVTENGAASEAGLQEGDRIIGIGDIKVVNQTDLLGILARHHPGDKVTVTYERDGKEHKTKVVLKNKNGTTEIVKHSVLDALGADFVSLTEKQAKSLGISGGVLVREVGNGLISAETDMRSFFVIIGVGNYAVQNKDELKKAFEKQGNNVMIKGFYIDKYGRRVTDMMYYAMHGVKSGMVN